MKLYYITLPRYKERYDYIRHHVQSLGVEAHPIIGIDGLSLSEEEIQQLCYPEYAAKTSRPTIGCTLSHREACQRIAESQDDYGIILEDDVIMPTNMNQIIHRISKEIALDEVILLFSHPYHKLSLSTYKVTQLGIIDPKTKEQLALYYPMTLEGVISAVAYCVGREAARGIVQANTPLSCNSDMWATLFSRGAFRRLRVLYPITVRIVGFRSTISPYPEGPLQRLISYLAYRRRLPLLYRYRLWRDRLIMERLWRENITFVDSPSPLLTE